MLNAEQRRSAWRDLRHALRDGSRKQTGAGHAHRAKYADRRVAAVRDKGAAADGAAVSRLGDQGHLGHRALADVAKLHQRPGLQANRLQATFKRVVIIQLFARLIAGATEVARAQQDHRHTVIDAGHLNAVKTVTNPAGRQQRPAAGAGDIKKMEQDRAGAARHAIDTTLADVVDPVGIAGDLCHRQLPRVLHINTHPSERRIVANQPTLDGERANGGENIAAVLAVIHGGRRHVHLGKQIVHIGVRPCGAADNRHFTGQRIGAADPVNLPGIRRAHHRQQHRITLHRIGRQIVSQKTGCLRGAAAHP